ncbi:MAG: 50S ribosomal protein L32e [Nanoarchaeota archaeon]|nr:50S ribosomal protein L32e [Nanoarchaeota archaeon]MBU4123943.1 50S ribosomal protein L32e [Nanoarchaeota archaeon]
MNLLKLRKAKKKVKPPFNRQNAKIHAKLGFMWRKPRGRKCKLRRHVKSRGFLPHPGYGSPKAVRFMHPSGLEEILVSNLNDMNGLNSEKQCVRIATTVGNRKKVDIQKKAEEMKIRILNPKKIELRGVK